MKVSYWGSPHCAMVKVLNRCLEISEFKLQSRYYIYFWTNTLGKSMNLVIPLVMSYIELLLFFYKDGFGIK